MIEVAIIFPDGATVFDIAKIAVPPGETFILKSKVPSVFHKDQGIVITKLNEYEVMVTAWYSGKITVRHEQFGKHIYIHVKDASPAITQGIEAFLRSK